jgi:hypothetical protein
VALRVDSCDLFFFSKVTRINFDRLPSDEIVLQMDIGMKFVLGQTMKFEFGLIKCAFGQIKCAFGQIKCAFGQIMCAFGQISVHSDK